MQQCNPLGEVSLPSGHILEDCHYIADPFHNPLHKEPAENQEDGSNHHHQWHDDFQRIVSDSIDFLNTLCNEHHAGDHTIFAGDGKTTGVIVLSLNSVLPLVHLAQIQNRIQNALVVQACPLDALAVLPQNGSFRSNIPAKNRAFHIVAVLNQKGKFTQANPHQHYALNNTIALLLVQRRRGQDVVANGLHILHRVIDFLLQGLPHCHQRRQVAACSQAAVSSFNHPS